MKAKRLIYLYLIKKIYKYYFIYKEQNSKIIIYTHFYSHIYETNKGLDYTSILTISNK